MHSQALWLLIANSKSQIPTWRMSHWKLPKTQLSNYIELVSETNTHKKVCTIPCRLPSSIPFYTHQFVQSEFLQTPDLTSDFARLSQVLLWGKGVRRKKSCTSRWLVGSACRKNFSPYVENFSTWSVWNFSAFLWHFIGPFTAVVWYNWNW